MHRIFWTGANVSPSTGNHRTEKDNYRTEENDSRTEEDNRGTEEDHHRTEAEKKTEERKDRSRPTEAEKLWTEEGRLVGHRRVRPVHRPLNRHHIRWGLLHRPSSDEGKKETALGADVNGTETPRSRTLADRAGPTVGSKGAGETEIPQAAENEIRHGEIR